jgi:hypothetical protein
MEGIFDEIRSRCAEVAHRTRFVAIDDEALAALALSLARKRPAPSFPDPGRKPFESPATALAFTMTLSAVNFGSGWFPKLKKLRGRSGYFTVATRLRERFENDGPLTVDELRSMDTPSAMLLFGQVLNFEVEELMNLFARSLRDLGAFVGERYGGDFSGPVAEADGSAARLVSILARMPLYRDVSRYEELEVPFMKRAQLLCADLHAVFAGGGPGRFGDLGSLTLFADNLVPHVLRMMGVLRYEEGLAARIDREETLVHGSPEEVSIRAVALHAVEELSVACGRQGYPVSPARLDEFLWTTGQSPEIKARPRHRAPCAFY